MAAIPGDYAIVPREIKVNECKFKRKKFPRKLIETRPNNYNILLGIPIKIGGL